MQHAHIHPCRPVLDFKRPLGGGAQVHYASKLLVGNALLRCVCVCIGTMFAPAAFYCMQCCGQKACRRLLLLECVLLSLTGSDRLWCGGRPAQVDVWNLKMSSAPETVAVRDTSDRQLLICLACSLSIALFFSLALAGSMSAHKNSHGQARLDLMDLI